jgi:hypothetical protein
VLAARQLGIAKIPVMVAAGWTEAQKRAYVLADNQLAITGSGWDPELANTSPLARARARGCRKSKTVAGRQGRALGDRSADPIREKCPHTLRRAGRRDCREENQDVTPEFVSRSIMIIRSSMIIFGMVVGMSITTNAETVKVMDEASTDRSFTIAQTNGQDRRDTRQNCRQGEGAVGADKRHCKQQGRQN